MRVRHVSDIDGALRTPEGLEANRKQALAATELEDFKHWLAISVASPTARAKETAKLEIREPDHLAERVEAVGEALLACLAGLQDCNSRTRRHSSPASLNRLSEYRYELDPEKTALQRETESWGQKIRWLQELRVYLEDERSRRETFSLGGSESRRVCA